MIFLRFTHDPQMIVTLGLVLGLMIASSLRAGFLLTHL
jgi:hypothetical protein